jgi:hypothetical protein
MPELHIKGGTLEDSLLSYLEPFAMLWSCDLQPIEDGYLLLPEVMLRKYGIFIFAIEEGFKVCREEDATSWEDFLLMKLVHELAERWKGTLYFAGEGEPLEVAPQKFATFDDYVHTVLEFEDELVRDMKKYWLYTHQRRALR